ncbi:MAG TPA: hypothetical protein VFK43_18345, partial [Acidimicrobiales bacterium]|nr:hypothetical protein [Acidimicrobiales bacterium]
MAIRSSRALDRGAALQRLLLALPIAFYAVRVWQRRWVTDDGFINFRIVQMVLAGHGPVFNAGERVEAATST